MLKKASFLKRVAAGFLDLIMLCVVCVGFAYLLSAALGFDGYSERLNLAYDEYEQKYGVAFGISQEDFDALDEAEKQKYTDASEALENDLELISVYNTVVNLSVLIVTLSLLASYLVLEFIIPLVLGNGQTLGKKAFAVGVVRVDCVRLSTFQLFVRTVLGKFTVETMIPVYTVMTVVFGSAGIFGTFVLFAVLCVELAVFIFNANRSLIHDLFAGTVAVDIATQKVFGSAEELLAYKNKLHAESVSNSVY